METRYLQLGGTRSDTASVNPGARGRPARRKRTLPVTLPWGQEQALTLRAAVTVRGSPPSTRAGQ